MWEKLPRYPAPTFKAGINIKALAVVSYSGFWLAAMDIEASAFMLVNAQADAQRNMLTVNGKAARGHVDGTGG